MKNLRTKLRYALYTLLCVVFFTIHYVAGILIYNDLYWIFKIDLILGFEILLLLIITLLFVDVIIKEHFQ